ncbi:hypothetical protein GCM10017674_06290 [Streptomyces gardneri]|uniref:Uncharacterized protein n=1 Tax=Streptomyces gardneri TaxID=66892 RepID=A0A4Y3RMM6_9ACTN|nr:hypothetical protein SGA01_45070 [Streptomyces gardneri]GHG83665.1 hypothetical protein GCM10017674_06290 [Streptomyces gardneri]
MSHAMASVCLLALRPKACMDVHAAAAPAAAPPGRTAGQDSDYVFTTRTGRTVEPMNLSRSFQRSTETA